MAGAALVPLAALLRAEAVGWALVARPCLAAPSMGSTRCPQHPGCCWVQLRPDMKKVEGENPKPTGPSPPNFFSLADSSAAALLDIQIETQKCYSSHLDSLFVLLKIDVVIQMVLVLSHAHSWHQDEVVSPSGTTSTRTGFHLF